MSSFCVEEQKGLAYHLEGLCVPQLGNHCSTHLSLVIEETIHRVPLSASISQPCLMFITRFCSDEERTWFSLLLDISQCHRESQQLLEAHPFRMMKQLCRMKRIKNLPRSFRQDPLWQWSVPYQPNSAPSKRPTSPPMVIYKKKFCYATSRGRMDLDKIS